MEALLNVTMQPSPGYEDRREPPEIHTHDVLRGDLIMLEAMGQRYQIHVAAITPETITLEVDGLSQIDDPREGRHPATSSLRRYTLPRNSPLSLSIPMTDKSPTWTLEWTNQGASRRLG